LPIDRRSIERCLEGHTREVRRHVLGIDADRYTRKCDGHRVNHRDVLRSDFMPEVASEHLGGSECQNHDREFQLLVLASVAKRGGES
jgi:hypothetical protein